jgi:hypothetical protein
MPITLDGTNGITQAGEFNSDSSFGFKNRIINGAMVIDQRNAGASVTPTDGQFSVDRWAFYRTQASKFTAQQNAGAVTPPTGFKNYLGITSSSAYSITSSDLFGLNHRIEGFNFSDCEWGTANAKTVTLSFSVLSSLTGTFGGSLMNGAENRSYPFTFTINAANTWEQKSITVAGDTSGTWVGSTNGIGLQVWFGLGCGSTRTGPANSWAAAQYFSANSTVSVVGTNGATFYITGVQLEVGSTATSFDYRPYGTELALCQRYYTLVVNGSGKDVSGSYYYTSSQMGGNISFPVQMRTNPSLTSVTGTNYYVNYANGATDFIDVIVDGGAASLINCSWYNNTQASGTAGMAGFIRTNNASSFVALSAEL